VQCIKIRALNLYAKRYLVESLKVLYLGLYFSLFRATSMISFKLFLSMLP